MVRASEPPNHARELSTLPCAPSTKGRFATFGTTKRRASEPFRFHLHRTIDDLPPVDSRVTGAAVLPRPLGRPLFQRVCRTDNPLFRLDIVQTNLYLWENALPCSNAIFLASRPLAPLRPGFMSPLNGIRRIPKGSFWPKGQRCRLAASADCHGIALGNAAVRKFPQHMWGPAKPRDGNVFDTWPFFFWIQGPTGSSSLEKVEPANHQASQMVTHASSQFRPV